MFRRPIINTLIQVGGKIVAVLIGLMITGLLTRNLGTEKYGSYVLISSLFVFLDSLADFGTKIIGVREAAGKDNEKKEILWVQVGWLRIFLSSAAFLTGLLVANLWKGFEGIRQEAFLGLVLIFFTSIAGSAEIIWQTKMKMEFKVAVDSLFSLLFLGLLWINRTDLNLGGVFVYLLIARVVSLIMGLGLIWVKGTLKKIGFWDRKVMGKLLKETWPMGLYLLVFASYDRAVDSLLIERYVGIKEVGWYGLAYKIYATLLQPVYFYVSSIFPLMSSKLVDKDKLMRYSGWIITGVLLVGLPVTYVLAPWMIEILGGSEFEPSVQIIRILLVAIMFSYLNHLWGFNLIAKRGQEDLLKVGLTALIVNIGLNILIIPRYGIIGAAGVTAVTEASSFLMIKASLRSK
ncbi:MAG: oligosaccharide flippase family protein [Patescibacteria group bacterium]|jgi:O-antigen/teichoic acid export membrane protein